jgi:hypothetical protein
LLHGRHTERAFRRIVTQPRALPSRDRKCCHATRA